MICELIILVDVEQIVSEVEIKKAEIANVEVSIRSGYALVFVYNL